MEKENNNENDIRRINIRVILLSAVVVMVGLFLIQRLFVLQIVDPEGYKDKTLNQQTGIAVLPAMRGSIYDKNHILLAQSATTWEVTAAPSDKSMAKNSNYIAQNIAQILDLDPLDVAKKLSKTEIKDGIEIKSNYVLIKKQVEKPAIDAIKEFMKNEEFGGLYYREDHKRYYQYDSLASSILGFVGDDGGMYGIENYYEDTLSGVDGRLVHMKGANGMPIPSTRSQTFEPEHGNSIVLTVHSNVQRKVETLLLEAIEEHQVANRGVVIVMAVNTGEIVAMASTPGFNPNEYLEIFDEKEVQKINDLSLEDRDDAVKNARIKQWTNKAVTEIYEPGSVFKVITAAVALDSGTSVLETGFYCSGSVSFSSDRKDDINCHKRSGHGQQNFTEAIMHSCNPASVEMSQRMGKDVFFKYFEAFGFTEKTGVDLPFETKSSAHNPDTIVPRDFASMGFGQSVTITPLQLITAVSATVNGGYLLTPRIVSSIEDIDGNTIQTFDREVKRQVISKETSKAMAGILEKAVSEPSGSGRNAYVQGYRIGGKTGTTQKLNQTEEEKLAGAPFKTISSFLGIAPADDPQYAVLVLLDEPFDPNSYASTLAAPVVGEMFDDILPELGIKPKYTEEEMKKLELIVAVPNLIGKGLDDAKGITEELGFKVEIVGEGDKVLRQVPAVGPSLEKDSFIVIYTEIDNEEKEALVPDVTGMGVKQAMYAIKEAGLNIISKGDTTSGSGAVAANQSVAGARMVPMGTVVEVEFLVYDQVA